MRVRGEEGVDSRVSLQLRTPRMSISLDFSRLLVNEGQTHTEETPVRPLDPLALLVHLLCWHERPSLDLAVFE